MSSRSRARLLLVTGLLACLAACDREERATRGKPLSESMNVSPALEARIESFERNAPAIAEGQRLFSWMNCVGCHAHGGGGMGPPLMDEEWRYGGRLDQIAATITDGRPDGMPRFKDKLTEDQIWQLAAYVRSLSGQVRKDAVASRTEEMSSTPPATMIKRAEQRPDDPTDQ